MAGKLRATIERTNDNASRLPRAKLTKLHRGLKTGWNDLVEYQRLQSHAFAMGKISYEDAQLLYRIYGEESPSAAKWDRLSIGEKVAGTKAADELIGMRLKQRRIRGNPIPTRDNPGQRLYESFHGAPPQRSRRVRVPKPTSPMIAIGRATKIEYQPYGSSQHKNIRFFHKFGDTGDEMLNVRLILATDAKGKNLFLIPGSPNYPYFSDRGIIG